MSTLDVLDYATSLREALSERLHPVEQRMAVREVRAVLERMAFRYALMDERPLPEDEDWVRALEALKPPEAVASVLARRQPVYRKRRIRRRVTTWSVLALIAAAAILFSQLAVSEVSEVVLDESGGTAEPTTQVVSYNFTVPDDATRMRFQAEVVVRNDDGQVTFTLVPERGDTVYVPPVTRENTNYRTAVVDPVRPGNWTLFVDFHDALAGYHVEIRTVHPADARPNAR